MKIRTGAALLSALALAACGGEGRKEGAANNSAAANSAAPADNMAAAATPADPTIVRDVSMAAELIRAQLPMEQPNGVTFTGVEARGAELVLDMKVPGDLDEEKFEQMEQQLPQLACNNPQAMETFRRGGTYTYRITDPDGETFTASVNSCTGG